MFDSFSSPIRGVLTPEGILRLEQPPNLPPGPVEVFIRPSPAERQPATGRDWWKALLDIQAGQVERGFVGTASDVQRENEAYGERMRAIYGNTVQRTDNS
jgi:hypothetical protein